MTRPRQDRAAWLPALLAAAGTLFVAVTAFRLAYVGSKGAALDAGIPEGDASWYPWCIEGTLVVASAATVVLPKGERRLGWAVLLAATGISCASNILHSLDHPDHHWWSPGAAAVPPLALAVCVRLAERVALARTSKSWTSVPPVAGVHPSGRSGVSPAAAAGPSTHQTPAGPVHPPTGPAGHAVDSPGVPSGVHPAAQSMPVDAAPSGRPGHLVGSGAGSSTPESSAGLSTPGGLPVDSRPDPDVTVHRVQGGRRPGRPAGHSPGRTQPDWREVDWYAVALDRGVSRSRAFQIIKAEPDAVSVAREQLRAMNGAAP
jgi:hypothetical protein